MASDQLVTSREVLRASMHVRRIGIKRILEQLERREPDLCEYLLEELTAIHGEIADTNGEVRRVQRVYRRVNEMTLTIISAIQAAHLRLWKDDVSDTRLAKLDPTLSDPTPGQPAEDAEDTSQS